MGMDTNGRTQLRDAAAILVMAEAPHLALDTMKELVRVYCRENSKLDVEELRIVIDAGHKKYKSLILTKDILTTALGETDGPALDIMERNKLEEALKEAEKRFKIESKSFCEDIASLSAATPSIQDSHEKWEILLLQLRKLSYYDEFVIQDPTDKHSIETCERYREAVDNSRKELGPCNSTRLRLSIDLSLFLAQYMLQIHDAFTTARRTYDEAMEDLPNEEPMHEIGKLLHVLQTYIQRWSESPEPITELRC